MSLQNLKTWKSYSLGYNSEVQKCWVPNCLNSRTSGYTKNLFHLPVDTKYRELWIAMAGKKVSDAQKEIYFCQDHFVPGDMEMIMNQPIYLKGTAVPFYGMPQKICRTCMSPIGHNESFSVLSRTIPSSMPIDMKLNLPQCRPEPLYQILTFCIPDLNLQPDPPPLICSRCYHNIWLYFVYKISSNAVEKGLRGNLTQEEYGKMVLCRTCPQTSGTSFFALGEDTLMGSLLKNMFLNDHPSDIVPLKVCLKCWNMLYKLKNFYEQCMTVDRKMQRHTLLNQNGLTNTQYAATAPIPLGNPKPELTRLREVRKSNHIHNNTDPNNKKDAAYPQRPQHIDQSICCNNVTESIPKSQTSNVDNSTLSPCTSVIKSNGNTEQQEEKENESNIPSPDAKDCLAPQIQSTKTLPPPSADCSVIPENGIRSKFPKVRQFSPKERIALAQLMLKYGEPLKYKNNPDIQFDAWISVVKEFHKINNQRSLESIQYIWSRMKKKAQSAYELIGPANYENQLVISYIYSYPIDSVETDRMHVESAVNVDREEDDVICIDDEMSVADKSDTYMEKVGELNVKNGSSSIISVDDEDPLIISVEDSVIPTPPLSNNKVPIKRGRGRPPKILVDKKLQLIQETWKKCDKSVKTKDLSCPKLKKKKKVGRSNMKEWGYNQNLDLAREIRKEYDNCLKNNKLVPGKSPWKMLINRVHRKKYKNYSFDKLYYLWTKMKQSATIYEKNGQDLVDEEVWELLQTQNAVQRSLIKNVYKKVLEDSKPRISPEGSKIANRNSSSLRESTNSKPSKNYISHDDSDSDGSSKLPVKSSSLDSKLQVKRHYKKKYQYWTEEEKMEFFKLIKQEFNSMVKNKESLACPWRKIIQRIASRGYKHSNQETLFSSWSAIRRNATLHENDRQLTMLDCKVLRLLRLAAKLKKIKETAKPVNDQEIPNVTAHSKKTVDKNTKDTASKTRLGKGKHRVVSRTDANRGRKLHRNAPDSDKDVEEVDDNGHKLWTHKEKLDLIEVIKRYGNTVFSGKLKRTKFWPQIVADHKANGHKRELVQVTSYWHLLHRSAKLAWAQQKETSVCDKVIIDFMMDLIEKKKKEGGCSNDSVMDEDESDDEISDRKSEFNNNLENEGTYTPMFGIEDDEEHVKQEDRATEHGEYNRKSTKQENPNDDDDIVNLNYDYVSLEDLDYDFGVNITNQSPGPSLKTEPSFKAETLCKDKETFKDEPAYVSMEDCGVEVSPKPQNHEIIVIDDSDEE